MKKAMCILLSLAFAACMLCGCQVGDTYGGFTADNEIFTYKRIDPEKTQLVVSITGNINIKNVCERFEVKNADVQIIVQDITGGNSDYKPLIHWIVNDCKPDVVISAAVFFDEELTTTHFENLSKHPVIKNYEAAALKRTATAENVYWLPGPSNISAMTYNKTLFDRYGWVVPKTFDEFVALCDKITADTNGEVQPWNPNAKYDQELLTAIEAFTYEELFGGVHNRSWYNDFVEGRATFSGHMEPYLYVLETLAEHGILKEEHFSYSATTRGKEFAAGGIAMINGSIYDVDSDEYDFAYMPFPSTKGELGYLCDSYSCYISLPVKEHTEKEDDAISRFIEYLSSPEGQRLYIGDSLKTSNVKGVALNPSDDLAALQPAIDAGHMFAVLGFGNKSNGKTMVNLNKMAMDITTGAMTVEQCVEQADQTAKSVASETPVQQPQEQAEVIATAPKDMTILETSFYIADAYREAMGADIGLISNNAACGGNLMRVFAGDITTGFISVLKPRSFANSSALAKLSMTGAQLLDALNAPVGYDGTADCIYAYSGLVCTVAPWRELGEKYISVKLANGDGIDPEKLYTVAAWSGTVADEYISDTLETKEGTWEELMTERLQADGTMAAADDGRIELVWD